MKTVYALIWTLTGSQQEFDERTPALMDWLRELRQRGKLRGCGGWRNADGGLTLVEADSQQEAQAIAASDPMTEIGITEIFTWMVFYADLTVEREW